MHKSKSRQDILAGYFNKSYGEFLFSGTLSIEAAFVSIGISKGDYVIVPDNVCYRVLLSVLRLQAIPIIIHPQNRLFLTTEDVQEVLNNYKVRTLILVHNFGLPVDIKSFKQICRKNIPIIEDASQAWDLKSKGTPMGACSDYVTTSFGITKPLSFGIGGALFSNDEGFKNYLDYGNKESRISNNLLLPYVLPETIKLDINLLTRDAFRIVEKQRQIAHILINKLKDSDVFIWKPESGDNPTWTKFPIWFKSSNIYFDFLNLAKKYNIIYELPHKENLSNLPLSLKNKTISINNGRQDLYQINIKMRFNSIKNIKNWINEYGQKK